MKRTLAATAAALSVLALVVPAHAESAGQFQYQVPAGWSACKGIDGFEASYCNPKGALIAIKSPIPGPDAAAIARMGLQGNEVLQDLALPFGGQPGHLVVTRFTQNGQVLLVAAAATAAGGGVKAVLLAEPAIAQESVGNWIALVNGGSFGGGGGAPEPARPTHKFTIKNMGQGCEAKVSIDGQVISVPAGQTRELNIPEGQHEFQWTDNSGKSQGATAGVPPAANLNAGCAAAGPPTQPPTTPPPTTGGQEAEFGLVADGARAAIGFYRNCWNLVFDKELLPEAKNIDRMMLKVVIRRPKQRWSDFLNYPAHLAALNEAMARTKDNPTARAELRRLAYYALYRAGQAIMMKQCVPSGQLDANALDCGAETWVKLANNEEAQIEVFSMMSVKFANIGSADDPGDIVAKISQVGR